jgi:hypothetical protein
MIVNSPSFTKSALYTHFIYGVFESTKSIIMLVRFTGHHDKIPHFVWNDRVLLYIKTGRSGDSHRNNIQISVANRHFFPLLLNVICHSERSEEPNPDLSGRAHRR